MLFARYVLCVKCRAAQGLDLFSRCCLDNVWSSFSKIIHVIGYMTEFIINIL